MKAYLKMFVVSPEENLQSTNKLRTNIFTQQQLVKYINKSLKHVAIEQPSGTSEKERSTDLFSI